MEWEAIFNIIANNGFAIFVAVYMLHYNNKSLTALTEVTNKACMILSEIERQVINKETDLSIHHE